jgi:hypothetical protein
MSDAHRGLFLIGARTALLYADNLPRKFFDLSSGRRGSSPEARTYRVRLAVVAPRSGGPSTRFNEMAMEERKSGQFALFETRDAAAAWLVTGEHEVVRE